MNDNDERPVTIIIGRVWKQQGRQAGGVHVMLVAPDEDIGRAHARSNR